MHICTHAVFFRVADLVRDDGARWVRRIISNCYLLLLQRRRNTENGTKDKRHWLCSDVSACQDWTHMRPHLIASQAAGQILSEICHKGKTNDGRGQLLKQEQLCESALEKYINMQRNSCNISSYCNKTLNIHPFSVLVPISKNEYV